MPSKYLDLSGLSYLWEKIKAKITALLPTSTSDLTNDSGFVVAPSGGTIGQVLAKASDADNDVEWVNQKGGYNFAFEIDGLDLKVTYGDSVEEPDFEIVNNNLVVTIE